MQSLGPTILKSQFVSNKIDVYTISKSLKLNHIYTVNTQNSLWSTRLPFHIFFYKS